MDGVSDFYPTLPSVPYASVNYPSKCRYQEYHHVLETHPDLYLIDWATDKVGLRFNPTTAAMPQVRYYDERLNRMDALLRHFAQDASACFCIMK